MGEEEIRQYLNSQSVGAPGSVPKTRMVVRRPKAKPQNTEEASFKKFSATHLLCPKCRRANPVREKVLLFLPDGTLYDYVCEVCGTSVGTRKA